MRTRLFSIVFVFLICMPVIQAMAQDTQQNNIFEQRRQFRENMKNQLSGKSVEESQRASGTQPTAADMAKKPSTQQDRLTVAYAQHVFTSACVNEYRMNFPADSLSEQSLKQLNAHMNGACACQYNALAAELPPEMITSYVMTIYGAKENGGEVYAPRVMDEKDPVMRVGVLMNRANIRKKCGFIN